MEQELYDAFVQFADIYGGRASYANDLEWLDNMDCAMQELCSIFGYSVGLANCAQYRLAGECRCELCRRNGGSSPCK
jgi:hypothetical protein